MNSTTARFGALLLFGAASLGCLIPGPSFDPFDDPQEPPERTDTRDGEVPDVTHTTPDDPDKPAPSYDPISHDERDDPNSPEYRGLFRLSFEGDVSAQFDSERLGESTYAYVQQDASGDAPHCLLALIDRRPDELGAQGYLLLQYVAPSCTPEGALTIWSASDRARPDAPHVVLGALRMERELGDDFTEWELDGPIGELKVVSHQDGRMRGELALELTKRSDDGGPWRDVSVRVEGNFEAIWMPIDPMTPPPR